MLVDQWDDNIQQSLVACSGTKGIEQRTQRGQSKEHKWTEQRAQREHSKGHKGTEQGHDGTEQRAQRGQSKGHKGDRAKGTKGTEQRAQRGQHRGNDTQGAAPKPELLVVASSLNPGST